MNEVSDKIKRKRKWCVSCTFKVVTRLNAVMAEACILTMWRRGSCKSTVVVFVLDRFYGID